MRQKNALIAQIAFQNKLNAEELKSNAEDLKVKDENLKNYQKIVKVQQDEITNLNDEIKKINAQESKLTAEELEFESEQRKIFRKIVKDQHNEIRKLYEDVRTKGKVKPSFQKITWSMDPCTINYGLPANKSRNFLKYSRFPNREGQYIEESKWGFQYVEEYQSSTYWLVFLDLLANH